MDDARAGCIRDSPPIVPIHVMNHPDKFTSIAQNTGDPIQGEWASKRNGTADFGFMKSFRRRYL